MLRHKAAIQAARYGFGFSGIYEPDEAERIQEAKDVTPRDSGIEAVKRKLAIDVEEEEEYIPGADEGLETEEEEQAA
jgi:hypothetical protein